MMYIMTPGKYFGGPKPTHLAHTALSKMVPKIKGEIYENWNFKKRRFKALLLNLGKMLLRHWIQLKKLP